MYQVYTLTEDTSKETEYQIPDYKPQHILSPEFEGTSNYEVGLADILEEKTQRLQRLRQDPKANPKQIHQAEEELKELGRLYENYNIGLNVFRTAKGGRDKIRK